MDYYNPEDTMNFNQKHTVQLKFQCEESTAIIITTMDGSVMGGGVLKSFTELDTGLTAPSDNPTNQKHCTFDEDDENNYKEIEEVIFYNANDSSELHMDLEEAADYLIGVEIIGYKE
jgi:hypothetical protein